MRRLLLVLALCFILSPEPLPEKAPPPDPPLPHVRDDGSALPDDARMEQLARTDPIAFLKNCIRRYDREVRAYSCTLRKQERLQGKLSPVEVIDVDFREDPFSVLLKWEKGKGPADRVLYVKGENDNKMLVLPSGIARLVGVVERDPTGPQARAAGRYLLTEFGIKVGMQRALAAWERAHSRDTLRVEFLGEEKVPELGDRPCWVVRRTGYTKPEEDGITESTFYFDTETWLQVGTILRGAGGQLIATYYFRDVRLNPHFKPDTFTRASLK